MNKRTRNALFTLAAALRLLRLGDGLLWYDEAFSVLISKLPFLDMAQAIIGDVHPPLYYAIPWAVSSLWRDAPAWAYRLPSVVLSLVAVWLAWKLTQSLGWGQREQTAVVAIMAVSPLNLHYAQEARMYALLQVLVLWATLSLLERRWGQTTAATALMLYTHNYGLIYGAALALVALAIYGIRWDWVYSRIYCDWFYSLAAGLMIWAPWSWALAHQMGDVAGGYWIQPVTVGSVLNVIQKMVFAFSMPEQFTAPGIMAVFGLLLYVAWRLIRGPRPASWQTLTIMAAAPLALSVLVSVAWKPILLFRPLIGSAPFIYLLAVSVWSRLSRPKRWYTAVVVAPIIVAALIGHYYYGPDNKGHAAEWVKMLEDAYQPGDVILTMGDNGEMAMELYAPHLRRYKLPPCEYEALGSLSAMTRDALGFVERDPDQIAAERLWMVYTLGPVTPGCKLLQVAPLIGGREPWHRIKSDDYTDAAIYLIHEW